MSETEKSLLARLRSLPAPAWILFAGTFINRFGSFVLPFLVLYLGRRGHTTTEAGMAVGAYGIGHLLANLIGGHLSDRMGRKRTLVLSMFSSAAAMIALAYAEDLWTLTLLTGLAGLCAELYRPAASALLTDLVPREELLTAFAVYRVAINAGFAIGPAVAGLLAERSFFLLFVGDALTSLLFGFLVLFSLTDVHKEEASGQKEEGWIPTIARDLPFLRFLLSCMAISCVAFQFESTFAVHVTDSGHSAATYGLLISLNGLLIVLVELPLTQVTRRFDHARVIAAGYVLLGLGFALTGFAHSKMALAGTVLIWTLGEILNAPMATAYVATLAPSHMRGRYMGAYGLTWSLGLIVGPWMGLHLYATSPLLLWMLCGLLGLLAAALTLWRR